MAIRRRYGLLDKHALRAGQDVRGGAGIGLLDSQVIQHGHRLGVLNTARSTRVAVTTISGVGSLSAAQGWPEKTVRARKSA